MSARRTAKTPPAKPGGAAPSGGLERVPVQRVELITAAILTAWALALHVIWLMAAGPLWRDEVGTIDFAAMPTWGDIWANLQYDNFPPLFVAIARCWMGLGFASDFGCRILGFLVGVGTLALFWWCARAFGGRAPLLALALYAVNPLAIRVGDSLRPYGLGIALTLLTLTLVWKFAESARTKWLVCAALAAVLSVQTLYQCALFVLAFRCGAWAAALSNRRWSGALATAAIGAAAAVSLLPHVVNIKKGRDWFVISQVKVPIDAFWQLFAGALNDRAGWMAAAWLALAVAAACGALFCGFMRRAPMLTYIAVEMIVAAVAYGAFLQFVGLTPRSWYFLILMAPTALAMDAFSGTIQAKPARLGRAALALLLAISCAPTSLAGVRMRQSNIDLVAARLKESVQPGDMVLVSPWYHGVSLQRYLPANTWTTLPPMQEIRIHRYDLMKKQMQAEAPIAPVLAGVERALRSGHALWVVGVFQFPPQGQPQPVLPPYHGEPMDMADARYFSSWMFQISQLVQSHATQGGQISVPSPHNLPINPYEDAPLLRFEGWHSQ